MSMKFGNGTHRGFLSPRLPIWQAALLFAVIAGWVFAIGSCTIAAAQQGVVKAKGGTSNTDVRKTAETSSGSCTVKAGSPALAIDPAKAAAESESNRSLSKEGDEAQPLEKLTLQSPATEDWVKDQIRPREESGVAEESRTDTVVADQATEQKCTRSEQSPKPKLERAN
jgi:hypothetical protein